MKVHNINKILIIGPSWLGDMIMAQSLFKVLKQQQNCIIDIVAPDWCRNVVERMPEISNSISLPVKHGDIALFIRYKLAKTLRAEKYNQAIILPNSWKSALIPFFAKIPKRIGWLGELRFGLINNVKYLNKKLLPMMVQRYVALVDLEIALNIDRLPRPQLTVDHNNQREMLIKFGIINQRNILAICPGSANSYTKRWPAKYYADLIEEKIKKNWDIWLFGSQQDLMVVDDILQLVPEADLYCKNFAGKLKLTDTIDLMSLATVVVSNDTGLLHLAASINKPVVAIYGSTDPNFAPPLTKNAKIISKNLSCSPCYKHKCPLSHHLCMNDIKPQQVIQAICEF